MTSFSLKLRLMVPDYSSIRSLSVRVQYNTNLYETCTVVSGAPAQAAAVLLIQRIVH